MDENETLAPDDYRRFNISQMRGALGWWLHAHRTGDTEGASYEAARDVLGHDLADELDAMLRGER